MTPILDYIWSSPCLVSQHLCHPINNTNIGGAPASSAAPHQLQSASRSQDKVGQQWRWGHQSCWDLLCDGDEAPQKLGLKLQTQYKIQFAHNAKIHHSNNPLFKLNSKVVLRIWTKTLLLSLCNFYFQLHFLKPLKSQLESHPLILIREELK